MYYLFSERWLDCASAANANDMYFAKANTAMVLLAAIHECYMTAKLLEAALALMAAASCCAFL